MKRFLLPSLILLSILSSCDNSSNKDYAPALTDSTSVTGFTGDSVKLVKTAGIRFKVTNVEQNTRAVAALAQKYGGQIHHQNFESAEQSRKELQVSDDSLLVISTSSPQAEITVRVPAQNLETFLFAVADLGFYTGSSQLKLDDRSLLYLENALKQKGRESLLTKPITSKPPVAGNQQAIQVKDEAVDKFIANKTIDADAAYSIVNLSLFQNAVVRKEMIANYAVTDYELPFGQRLKNALSTGWEAFLNFLLAISHLWMFILLGLFAFVFYKQYQSRRKAVG